MNKYYAIIPCVLLAVFLVFQRDFQKRRNEEEKARTAGAALAQAARDDLRAKQKQKAEDDMRRRNEERETQERERAEKKRRDYETALQKIQTEADAHAAGVRQLAQESASLEQELAALRAQKRQTESAAFELARKVEEHRVERRTAEIEIQRTTKMVAARLAESAWANPTPTAPLP